MNIEKNNNNLDELITNAISRDNLKFDFNKWKNEHEKEVQIYKSQITGTKATFSVEFPNIWRTIMRSKMNKLTTAVTIILIAAISIFLLNKSTANVYAITDVPKILGTAKTLHFKGFSTIYPENEEAVSYPVECWIDFENRYYRSKKVLWFPSHDSYTYSISEDFSNDEYNMYIDYKKEEAGFTKNTPLRQRIFIKYQYYMNDKFLSQFTTQSDQLKNFKVVAQEKIDGEVYDVWENNETPGGKIIKLWLSPGRGKIGRYYVKSQLPKESEEGLLPGGLWTEYVIDVIERNSALSSDTFNMIPPAGYKIINNKENASLPELLAGGNIKIGTLCLKIHIVCTLSDGSVIVGWSISENDSSKSYEDLFQNSEFGGALPKTLIELYALNSTYKNDMKEIKDDPTYTGRHLAFTKKGNTFYEWGIYVPALLRDNQNEIGSYIIMFRSNPDDIKSRGILMAGTNCVINSEKDFNIFVLDSMAELSDNGKLPENITYEKVLELAQQIREKIKK